MTDKEKTIKELKEVLDSLDITNEYRLNLIKAIEYLQEEPVSKDRLAFKAIPRLLEMLEPNDRAKTYTTRLADALEKEGYITDAKLARESIKVMNGEKVAMATMDEEPVSIDFEKELYKAFGQVKDFTLGMRIAKWFYDMGKNSQEPTSEVWHDMSESVENGRNIIIIDPAGFYGAVLRKGGSQLKNHNKERYVKWAYIDDLQNLSNVQRTVKNSQEPVSEDLEEAVNTYIGYPPEVDECSSVYGKRQAFKAGAKWKVENLWKPADGDDLPIIDREVIVLTQPYPLEKSEYAVYYAHRPNPNGWDGKSVTTGKVEHYTPKTYDKGGWSIPNVVWWLDCDFPKKEEV